MNTPINTTSILIKALNNMAFVKTQKLIVIISYPINRERQKVSFTVILQIITLFLQSLEQLLQILSVLKRTHCQNRALQYQSSPNVLLDY